MLIVHLFSPLVPDEDCTNVLHLVLHLDEGEGTGTKPATEVKSKVNGVVGNAHF